MFQYAHTYTSEVSDDNIQQLLNVPINFKLIKFIIM